MNYDTNLSISNLNSELGLFYFDPNYEALREINQENIEIRCRPYEKVIRRFYICGTLLKDVLIKLNVEVEGIQKHLYDVKVLWGRDNPRPYDFDFALKSVTITYGISENYFANAIPVDILLISKEQTEASVILDISLQGYSIIRNTTGEISCIGANDRVGLLMDINPDSNYPNTYIKLVVNGAVHIITPSSVNPTNTALPMQEYIEQNLSDILEVYPVESSSAVGIGNKTSQNIRLELGAGSNVGYGIGSYNGLCIFINELDVYTTENPNPTIIEENELGVSTVCLAPTQNSISCEGATDSMRFSSIDYDYELWVDGIYYPSENNPAETIRRELSDILSSADDGFWSVRNLDSVPHRIRLVRRSGGNEFDYTVGGNNENQSFMELEDGSLVFCLAPVITEQYLVNGDLNTISDSPQGACELWLNNSGDVWGAILPSVTASPISEEDTSGYCRLYGGSNNYTGNVGSNYTQYTPNSTGDLLTLRNQNGSNILFSGYSVTTPDVNANNLRLKANGNTLFSGVINNLTLINSTNQIIYRN